jgi:hypothetical protein
MEKVTEIREYFCDACGKKLDFRALVDTLRSGNMFCDEVCAVAWFMKFIRPQLEETFKVGNEWKKGRITK